MMYFYKQEAKYSTWSFPFLGPAGVYYILVCATAAEVGLGVTAGSLGTLLPVLAVIPSWAADPRAHPVSLPKGHHRDTEVAALAWSPSLAETSRSLGRCRGTYNAPL